MIKKAAVISCVVPKQATAYKKSLVKFDKALEINKAFSKLA